MESVFVRCIPNYFLQATHWVFPPAFFAGKLRKISYPKQLSAPKRVEWLGR
jgi:hypothetical protein